MASPSVETQSAVWPWPASLDALMAAPLHHKLMFENVHVRVLDTVVRAGDTVPLHTHRYPSVLHVLSWSHCVRRDANGRVQFDTRLNDPNPLQTSIAWCEPLPPHSLENVGTQDIHVIMIEIKEGLKG
jgi:quercetin dioxygenase-like cupin family protein